MIFSVLTIFPELFETFWETGIIKKAIEQNKISCSSINIRDFAVGKHKITDDKPYGGGCGMVMKPEPISGALKKTITINQDSKIILLTPQGDPFNQTMALDLSSSEGLIFICGRYEGVDERIFQKYVDHEISIGDFVLTGGELAAMVIIDAITRLIPGVLGGDESAEKDTFSNDLVEHAHYTRPYDFDDLKVPEILLSGHHKEIDKWRFETSLIRTFLKRPDLLVNKKFNSQEKKILKNWCSKIEKLLQT